MGIYFIYSYILAEGPSGWPLRLARWEFNKIQQNSIGLVLLWMNVVIKFLSKVRNVFLFAHRLKIQMF